MTVLVALGRGHDITGDMTLHLVIYYSTVSLSVFPNRQLKSSHIVQSPLIVHAVDRESYRLRLLQNANRIVNIGNVYNV